MAKYTIISFIQIDFVPIFIIFNLFRRIFRGSFRFKKISSLKKSQVDFRGGGSTHFNKVLSSKKSQPRYGAGGGDHHFGLIPKFCYFFLMESFPKGRFQKNKNGQINPLRLAGWGQPWSKIQPKKNSFKKKYKDDQNGLIHPEN